jgi:hypothetical protein
VGGGETGSEGILQTPGSREPGTLGLTCRRASAWPTLMRVDSHPLRLPAASCASNVDDAGWSSRLPTSQCSVCAAASTGGAMRSETCRVEVRGQSSECRAIVLINHSRHRQRLHPHVPGRVKGAPHIPSGPGLTL